MGSLKMKYSPYQQNQSKHPSTVKTELVHTRVPQHFFHQAKIKQCRVSTSKGSTPRIPQDSYYPHLHAGTAGLP